MKKYWRKKNNIFALTVIQLSPPVSVKRIEIMDESGIPIYIFDLEKWDVMEEDMYSEEKTLKSSLIVAALQGLRETGEGIKFIETKTEKYIVLTKDDLVFNFILPSEANLKNEKLLIFIHSVAEGVVRINRKLGLEPEMVDIKKYVNEFRPIFEKYLKKLIQKIF